MSDGFPPNGWYLRIEKKIDKIEERLLSTPTRTEIITLIVALFTIVGIVITASITLANGG